MTYNTGDRAEGFGTSADICSAPNDEGLVTLVQPVALCPNVKA